MINALEDTEYSRCREGKIKWTGNSIRWEIIESERKYKPPMDKFDISYKIIFFSKKKEKDYE